MSETGFGAPCRLCNGRSLMRCLRACQGDVHVAHTGSLRQVCFGCQRTHGKCEIGGKPVMVQGPRKKRKVISRATVEGDEDDAEWVVQPTPKVTGTAESLFSRALTGIVKEMKASRKSSERIAQETLEVSRAMLSQTTALVDLVELVVQVSVS